MLRSIRPKRAALLALARTIARADAPVIAEGNSERGPMAEPWALLACHFPDPGGMARLSTASWAA